MACVQRVHRSSNYSHVVCHCADWDCLGCRENREAIDKIVERLIVDETIRGEDFREMLSKYTNIPESNMATPTKVESSIPANI